jgi:hypothetical protein
MADAEAIHLVEDGNITDMPTLTREDVRRAYEIYGSRPEFVRGKMTRKKVSRASIDESLMLDEKKQVLLDRKGLLLVGGGHHVSRTQNKNGQKN